MQKGGKAVNPGRFTSCEKVNLRVEQKILFTGRDKLSGLMMNHAEPRLQAKCKMNESFVNSEG